MRIVQISPGTGDTFYCDNCLRDTALIKALQRQGHDVSMVPMYLPVQLGEEGQLSNSPIFFGGINVYLQQKSGLFRRTPRWIDRIFDSPKLLKWIGRKGQMTSAKELGRTTVSMLRGEQGRQVKELNRLIEWLGEEENKPDVVILSNVLLAGLAKSIKARLGVPVLCLLQDEDAFLDGLTEPYSSEAWRMLAELADSVDVFIAVSKYYAGVMQQRLQISADRARVVYMGISLDGYDEPGVGPNVPTVGYLSRMCYDKGLETLVEAFITLKRNPKLENARLRVAGGQTGVDKAFINRIRQRLRDVKVADDVEFLTGFDRDTRIIFLRTLSLLSVPERRPVAHALYVLEALAAGVPVVEPASGVFPELLDKTGGGVLYEANDASALVAAIEPLLLDRDNALKLGRQGREAVFAEFDVNKTAEEMVRICNAVV
ncbi:MAG: glycosyltransferase family 4 protein [Planctomycetota bacterium]